MRAIVIGCPGAGKSVFARNLRDIFGTPLYYLDMIWHRADRTNISREEFDLRLQEILKHREWIIDGNYLRTLEMRLKECNTVFLLDYSLEVCLKGAKSRIGKKREDLPWVEGVFDQEFKQWIIDFGTVQLPQIYQLLEQYDDRKIVIFKEREEADKYLKGIREGEMKL